MITEDFEEISIKGISNNVHCMNNYDALVEIKGMEFALYRNLNFKNVNIESLLKYDGNNINIIEID